MKYILPFVFLLFINGCGGASSEYLLSVPAAPTAGSHLRYAQIGVDQVSIPDYLSSYKIPKMEMPGVIEYCGSDRWVSRPEKALTEHLIAYLKQRFHTPNVHRFPWDVEKSNGIRVKVEVNKFVYTGNAVELDANYFIEPLSGSRKVSRTYSTKVAVQKGETPLIVAAMNKAFDRLSEHIARSMARF